MDIVTLALAKKYADSINSGITNITTENNKLIFTLQNGNTIEVPLPDLVNNVVTEEELLNKLKDYIKNTDFASAEKAGIIKVDATSYATELDNGKLKASTKTYENYKDMNNESFIGKGTLENVIAGKNLETANNKVTFVDEDSTDAQYPSAKAMYKISNKLDTLKDEVLDTGGASDSFIHIEDSAISELQELEIEGVCEQKTTTGKNLARVDDTNISETGYTLTTSKGLISVTTTETNNSIDLCNGTRTGRFLPTYDNANDYHLTNADGGSYQLSIHNVSANITGSSFQQLIVFTNQRSIMGLINASGVLAGTTSITLQTDEYVKSIYLWTNGTTTISKLDFYLQLEKSSTATPYEPYTGGQPSPSPDYPQEISTITDSLSATSCNKNLFDKNDCVNGKALGDDGTLIDNAEYSTSNYRVINPNVSMTISGMNWGRICLYDETRAFIKLVTNNSTRDVNFDTPKNARYYKLSSTINSLNNVQLEQNPTSTPFEEHIQSQITANLPEGEFIGKIDDTYKDTLSVELQNDGKYHLVLNKQVRYLKLPIIDMNNSDSYPGWKGQIIQPLDTDFPLRDNFLSEYTNYIGNITNYKNIYKINTNRSGVPVLYFNIASIFGSDMTQTKVKEKYPNLMVDLYYGISKDNQYTVDLGVVDMPLSYNEITNIFTDSDLLPKINAKYYRNFISTVRNLQVNEKALKQELIDINNRLSALETATTNVTSESEVTE